LGSIIFVHGTGVRQQGYEKTFKQIEEQLEKRPETKGLRRERCVWGAVHGSRLLGGGGSIPGYKGKSAAAPEDEVLKWWLLYQDPLFELKTFRENSDLEMPPRWRTDWENRKKELAACEPSVELQRLLSEHGLDQIWMTAWRNVVQTDEWKETLPGRDATVNEFFPPFCQCVAEAVMAETSLLALAEGVPAPDAEIRNQIVKQFLTDLNAIVRGPREWFDFLGKTVKRMALGLYAAGDYIFSEIIPVSARDLVTDAALPLPGDILYYQARGEKIRAFIEKRIEESEAPVFLLAHSLGGIACVDLLIEKDLRHKVAGLITAGSQAPLFYELDCLVKRPRDENTSAPPLPAHFPPWLNFHDPNDYLSYAAQKVFKSDRIADEEIKSRQPHLMAHSAYWSQRKVWDRIAGFIRDNQNNQNNQNRAG
jgi:hypothetical protein